MCEQQGLLFASWLSIKLLGVFFKGICSSSPTENHFLLVLDGNSTTPAPISSTLNNSPSCSASVQSGCLSVVSSPTREEEEKKKPRLASLAPAKPAHTHNDQSAAEDSIRWFSH